MDLEKEDPIPNRPALDSVSPLALPFLQKFVLYETRSNYYMVGRDKSRTLWRLLKIDRLGNSELNIFEDITTYSENELDDMLKQIDKENKSTGGLILVTVCYGIVGFFKFLGPQYMLLITDRKEIGVICGHKIYSIAKTKMITISNSTVQPNMPYSKNENRYKKLLNMVDLTKDFFFSYSYQVMHSLQKNFCDTEAGKFLYDSMFVWNEYLTRDIRNKLKNTEWTVALVYGFFHQVKLSISGREFLFTLIARRSRHYAGTRYLRRGIDENGQAANDVETEQIVFEGVSNGSAFDISSVVQFRGSIPLFWSQESSRLNMKPDIKWRKDLNYETTKLHFENLVRRYGNPIIILNLIKTREKKPRESILRAEFANAIAFINKDLSKENRLRFLHWDLNNNSQNKATNTLELLRKIAAYAVNLTDIFCCHITPTIPENSSTRSSFEEDCACVIPLNTFPNHTEDDDSGQYLRPSRFQNGVLRTNCIDCLDRTNVAQYAYGWVALGHQLHALGFVDNPSIDLNIPLADELMRVYEIMGDTLALQYGGSAAHNKIFSERRGQWKPATQSQEFLRTFQRYINNAYMDSEKQDAINVFLGHFEPLEKNGGQLSYYAGKNAGSLFRRSQSDGNLLYESNTFLAAEKMEQEKGFNHVLQRDAQGASKGSSESTPDGFMGEHDATCSRQLITDSQLAQCTEGDHFCNSEHGDSFDCSNFLDVEWLSSSGNSCEEEASERSSIINSSLENFVNASKLETSARGETGSTTKGGKKPEDEFTAHIARKNDSLSEYSDSFIQWVSCGEALFH